MKRCLCLVLCLLLLFLCACKRQESEEEPPAPEMGVFYTADGMLQNALVSLAIFPEGELVAPVTRSFKAEFYNGTDYPCNPSFQVFVDKWQDEEWISFTKDRGELGAWTKPFPPKTPHPYIVGSWITFYSDDPYDFKYQLEPGLYRARLSASFIGLPEEYEAYQNVTAVTYFTVSAPE